MQHQSILEVASITEGQSTNHGFKFKTVTFTETKVFGNKQIKTNKSAVRNLFPEREIEVNGVLTKFKADVLYNDIKKGDLVSGAIHRFNTSSYDIAGRTVNSWTGIVFEGEDAVKFANSQLKSNNACVITADGTEVNSAAELAFAEPVL